ncbi:hypothetical protein GUJ93_ZPchr0002g25012 [Zizania palustris]|uniref:Uncharacterized protein n=1 Tax=Zizania palustris TaxID=103762 RepID=A0A8J5VWE7_ZIZPA|nr:hypothetical protein GUJ93_ZPchr0002g25012 [Zizania palustris]
MAMHAEAWGGAGAAMEWRSCRSTGRSGWRWQVRVRRRGGAYGVDARAQGAGAPGAVRAARRRGCSIRAPACGLAQLAACGLARRRDTRPSATRERATAVASGCSAGCGWCVCA